MSPLVVPAQETRQRAERALGQRLDPIDGLDEQQALLQVGGELQEGEELRDARRRDLEPLSCLALVAKLARTDRGVDRVREREHDRHARRPADWQPHDGGLLDEALPMPDPDPV